MQWLWLKTSIPVLSFVSEFQGGFVSLQVENAGAKTVWIQHLLGWAGQGHSTLGSKAGMEGAWILHLLLPWALENPEESRGVCADSNARWVFVLCPREGRLCTASDAHTHRAALLQQSPSVKGKRGFDCLPANLVANCQCFCSSCAGLFHPAIPELAVPFQK